MLSFRDEDAVCCARGLGLETCIGRRGSATLFRNVMDYDFMLWRDHAGICKTGSI
jgi:hypothetical protein